MWPDWANFKAFATINLPKSLTFLGNFCKGVKMYYFSSDIIFGLLLWTLGDYFLVTVLGGYAFESVCWCDKALSSRAQNRVVHLKLEKERNGLCYRCHWRLTCRGLWRRLIVSWPLDVGRLWRCAALLLLFDIVWNLQLLGRNLFLLLHGFNFRADDLFGFPDSRVYGVLDLEENQILDSVASNFWLTQDCT